MTVAECCFDTGLGVEVDIPGLDSAVSGFGDVAALFGESASRVVVSSAPGRTTQLLALAAEGGVAATVIGRVGGHRIRVALAGRGVIDEPRADAERLWSDAIGNCFESRRAIA